eukprot:sb/3463278/
MLLTTGLLFGLCGTLFVPENCRIEVDKGFLKKKCDPVGGMIFNDYHLYQCHNSENYYYAIPSISYRSETWILNSTCPEDRISYEMCGYLDTDLSTAQEGGGPICGIFGCTSVSLVRPQLASNVCTLKSFKCGNFQSDMWEGYCRNTDYKCNGVCDSITCSDEEYCNGYTYGMKCGLLLKPPMDVCFFEWPWICRTGIEHAANTSAANRCIDRGDDTNYCPSLLTKTMEDDREVPLFNFTRCSTITWSIDMVFIIPQEFVQERYSYFPVCTNFMDQTNCSDPDRVALYCPINGYRSSVAKIMVCGELQVGLCDDGLDLLCVQPSEHCRIHKHQLCDLKSDCPLSVDERQCESVAAKGPGCRRKLRPEEGATPIPIPWLMDGVYTRFVTGNSVCEDVFVCRFGPTTIIPQNLLCDGINTCGSENGVCQKHVTKVFQRSIKRASEKWVKYVAFCQLGLEKIITQDCGTVQFTAVEIGSIFGVDKLPVIHLPDSVSSCRYFYGEQYVYLACSDRCGNAVGCPLQSAPLKTTSCPDQYKNRVYTLFKETSLTFVIQKQGHYIQELFECDNGGCLEYENAIWWTIVAMEVTRDDV